MSNIANITIEWSAEDRARIDKLIAHLERLGVPHEVIETKPTKPTETPTEPAKNDEIEPEVETEPTQTEMSSLPLVEDETDEILYDLTDVMAKVQQLIQAGKKDQVKTIVQQYAPNVSSIPADKFGDVINELTALEG